MTTRSFIYRNVFAFFLGTLGSLGLLATRTVAEQSSFADPDPLLGPRVDLKSEWVGRLEVPYSINFLILAGHADSQGISGAGTAGEAVAIQGQTPMNPSMSDELYWNLLLRDAIVQVGRERGLNITGYEPGIRNIDDGNHPITNWSVGAQHAQKGGYALEIHFDSYGDYGFGSGLIPAISRQLNAVDESLANSFGRYPMFFRGGLGAPKRGIRILEVGKLEGKLEKSLRNEKSRDKVIKELSIRIVQAIMLGMKKETISNPLLDEDDTSHQVSHR